MSFGTGLGWGVDRGLGGRAQKKNRQGGKGRGRWEPLVAMLLFMLPVFQRFATKAVVFAWLGAGMHLETDVYMEANNVVNILK